MRLAACLGICLGGSTACLGDDVVPQEYVVRGVAIGVLEPLSLELRHTGGSEIVSIIADGPFAFETPFEDRDSYSIEILGTSPCVLENGNGVISGADSDVVLACEGAPYLTDITLSGLVAPDLGVSLTRTEYTADVSLMQQSVSITPIALRADATITIAGQLVASGTASAPLPLGLGDNEVELVVSHPSGSQRTYRVTVRRAAALVQYAHGEASNPEVDDLFGWRVALSGDTLAVGALNEDSAATGVGGNQADNSASFSGAVYVFRRSGTAWTQEAYLKASNTGAGDGFGASVALSGDTLAVGAFAEDSAATGVDGNQDDDSAIDSDSGAVYVFRRSGTAWAQEAYLKASNTGAGDGFGANVALSGDTLAVGALNEDSAATGVDGNQDDDSAADSGAVYVFRRSGTGWAQEAYLKASNTGAGDKLGASVALSGDTLAVGARFEDSAATGVDGSQDDEGAADSGAVYVFRRAGTGWVQEVYLKSSETGTNDNFGTSVALSSDTLAVGTPSMLRVVNDSIYGGGAVYIIH